MIPARVFVHLPARCNTQTPVKKKGRIEYRRGPHMPMPIATLTKALKGGDLLEFETGTDAVGARFLDCCAGG